MSLAGRFLQRIHPDVSEANEIVGRGADASPAPEVPPSIAVVPASEAPEDVLADLRREALEHASLVGMTELRAAALMVAEGEATRVTLAGFPTWPGLLTEIERLSREFDLSIIPTIVRPGGRVDLVVSAADGNRD